MNPEEEEKGRAAVEGFAEKEGFKPGMKEMEYQIIVSVVCVHVVRFRQSVLRTGTDRHAAGYHGNQDANI